ncbi:unnamed protein product [Calypogeia fissa]
MATAALQVRVAPQGMAASASTAFRGIALSPSRFAVVGLPLRRPISITADLQRWERKKVKDNSLPITQTLHVKVGDTVQVIAGVDKKKVGEVVKIFTHNSKIVVKNINFKTKHVKGKAEGESGQIIQIEAAIHSSNVMLYSKEKKVASRVGHKTLEDGRKVRYLLKTGEVIDKADDWKKIYKSEKKDK